MRHPTLRGRSRVALALAVYAASALAGCRLPVGARGDGGCGGNGHTCPFATTGPAAVTGTVVGLRDQPLAGVRVVGRDGPGRPALASGLAESDAAGAFHLRLTRYESPPPGPGPDSVSLWLVGFDPATAGIGVPARVRDSVLVRVTVSPAGATPEPTRVRLTLPAP